MKNISTLIWSLRNFLTNGDPFEDLNLDERHAKWRNHATHSVLTRELWFKDVCTLLLANLIKRIIAMLEPMKIEGTPKFRGRICVLKHDKATNSNHSAPTFTISSGQNSSFSYEAIDDGKNSLLQTQVKKNIFLKKSS